ncbi:MAG TPA: GNAT family N-acetyltransferase [Aggregatilinea sp.]|uniref:GNAT family N-acetyltransferase n=1 Tax=Aggregatilinea sp. TaxID=2806333 RepID=UPI002C63A6E0|nr:GNAT family N-acetyltransferase [Aggregatilinea sp.]HML24531.1 GNAT family N-acetyltransferase [Aggregatilinea sp.]
MDLTYRANAPVTAQQVADLFRSAGLRRPVDDLDRIQRMIQGADLIVSAWDGGRLVGIARSITDFAYCCYLSDLAVSADYQRQGIGQALIDRTRAELGDEVMLLLLSVPDAMTYYPRVGFEPVANGWIIHRAR